MLKVDRGEVSEWSNVHAWKACVVKSNRGFKSRPLRQEILSFKMVRLGVFALNFFVQRQLSLNDFFMFAV